MDMKEDIDVFKKFKKGMLNYLREPCNKLNQEDINDFHGFVGAEVEGVPYSSDPDGDVRSLFEKENEPQRFYSMLEKFIKLSSLGNSRTEFIKNLDKMIQIHNINLSICHAENEVILRPRGEDLLNAELVEKALSFLNPESQKHFMVALKGNKKSKDDFIKSAESIRRCVEEFLRFKLKNSANLDPNINALGKQLKANSISRELSNIITQMFSYLEKYFNENSKHNDGDVGEHESEFLIYQVAVLMRYINNKI